MKALALAALLMAGPLAAQEIAPTQLLKASDPAGIARYLNQLGYKAKQGRDSEGDPKIETGMGGYTVTLVFYGCEAGANCTSLQFQTGVSTGRKLTLAQVNSFNARKRFAQMHLDEEQDPWIFYDLPTAKAGVTADAFAQAVDIYESQLGEMARMIEEAGKR